MIRLYIQAIARLCFMTVVTAVMGFSVLASVFILGAILGRLIP